MPNTIFHMTIFHDTASASGEPMLERVRSCRGHEGACSRAGALGGPFITRPMDLPLRVFAFVVVTGSGPQPQAKWVFGPAFPWPRILCVRGPFDPTSNAKPVRRSNPGQVC